jgi:hypothetical protein
MAATNIRTLQPRQEAATLGTLRTVLFAAAAALPLAASAFAQTNSGNVYGNVTEEQGSPIPGGTVTLTGAAAPRTAKVDASGVFRFPRVAPGRYTVTVTMAGLAAAKRENVLVSVGQNTRIDLKMRLQTVQEDVTVINTTRYIDTRKVETGQNFSGDQLTQIPTARDVWALIQQIPGVQLDNVNVAGNASARATGPGLTSKGSGNVAYEIDGATITDNTYGNPLARQNGGASVYFDFSTLEDVQAATGGSILEQQASGVTINVVTRRGTNQLKGSARYLYASANWQSDNTPAQVADAGLQSESTRFIREYGAELGGPILKDRVWLWAAGSRQDISLSPPTFTPGELPYPETTVLEPWSAKLNAQISIANAASLYFLRSYRIQDGTPVAPDRPPETRQNFLNPTDFYKVEDSHVFSPDLFGSIFASYASTDYLVLPVGGLERDVQYYGSSWHNTYTFNDGLAPQRQANLQVSRFFNTGRVNHELKVSFNYRQLSVDSLSGLPGSRNQGGVPWNDSVALLSRNGSPNFVMQYWTGTISDTLTTGNLTVAAGLRYDLQQMKNRPTSSPANPLFDDPCVSCGADGGSFPGLPEVAYHGSSSWQFQFTDWQPRVSATYALGEKKSTLLRASYARFADQLNAGLFFYAPGAIFTNGYYYVWKDLNKDHNVQPDEVYFNQPQNYLNGVDPATVGANPNQIQPGLRTSLTSEITAGIDYQVTDDWAVSGTFSYRITDGLFEQIPVGTSLSTYELGGRVTGTFTENGSTHAFNEPYYVLNLPAAPSGVEVLNRPGETERYYGLNLSTVKRLSSSWTLRANFGWNSFRQYLTPASIQDPNNLWMTGSNDNGGLAGGENIGPFLNGAWQFNVNGLYQAPWGLAFGANFYGRQGYPKPLLLVVDPNSPATSELDILIDRVDTFRYDNVYELDFRLQKTLAIGPVEAIVAAEVFNVANANTVLQSEQRVGTYDSASGYTSFPSFGQIVQIQSPRILRLSLQVNF